MVDRDGRVVDEIRVRASSDQIGELREWASAYDDRCWAVESVRGLGYLISQQLVAAGERVIDVPAMMASRVRLLGSGKSQKSDPNDARSVAIAALRHSGLTLVGRDDHAPVLSLLAKRHLSHIQQPRFEIVVRPHAGKPWGFRYTASRLFHSARARSRLGSQLRILRRAIRSLSAKNA